MKTVKLKDLVDFSNGYAFKSTDYVEYSNTVNCRMSNIRPDGSFDVEYNIKYLPDEFAEKYKGFILNDGDIIIAMTDMAGDPKILGVPTLVNTKGYSVLMNQRVGKLTLKSKDIHPTYLKYYLMSNYARNYFKSFAGGGVQLNIGQKEILNIDIKLCDIKEQVEICNVLDKINVLIQQNSKQIEKLDQLIKSRFIELFGGYDLSHAQSDWKYISKIGKVMGGATPKTNIEEYWDGEYRWITPAELSADSGYIYDSVRKLTKAGVDSCSLQEMPIDTVILSSRAPIGKVAIAGNTFYCNQGFKNIICNKEILPRYLYTVLLLNTEYLNSLGRGATFKEISKSIVENIRIPVPPIELQEQFAAFVEQTDKSKLAVQQSLEKLETLKKSLMQQYFG